MAVQPNPERTPVPRGTSSDPNTWSPVSLPGIVPVRGVTVEPGGLFEPAMAENAAYLLRSFSVDHMLYPFRKRAGEPNPPGGEEQIEFWDTLLEGSNAGRFLMGAGNTLRWREDAELRRRLDAVVDGIEACRTPDGYIHGFVAERMIGGDPGRSWGEAQRSNYARAWLTHGLIEAWLGGNTKALPLARSGHDWFNHCPYLSDLPKVQIWYQGHIAGTRMFFTPAGRPEDLQVSEKHYVVDGWMAQLAARNPDAIWLDGLRDPHCYLITAFEAYLDHYFATGDRRYLEAVEGAWEMMRRYWLHAGGSMAICEGDDYPPGSRFISGKHTGEFCGSVFWVKLNQRFHRLRPDDERYAAEIERSLYNVALANLVPGQGIRYHARLEGFKQPPSQANTCCEGMGTRLLGSLPEYIYTLADDGVYVNLYEPSTLAAEVAGGRLRLRMETAFPRSADVRLRLEETPGRFTLRLRIPSWVPGPMAVQVNGAGVAEGQPGSYLALAREWRADDRVEFALPAVVRLTCYRGADNTQWLPRFALEYGPLLLAVVATPDPNPNASAPVSLPLDPNEMAEWLQPVPGEPLRWRIVWRNRREGPKERLVLPYWQVPSDTHFSCFPTLKGKTR